MLSHYHVGLDVQFPVWAVAPGRHTAGPSLQATIQRGTGHAAHADARHVANESKTRSMMYVRWGSAQRRTSAFLDTVIYLTEASDLVGFLATHVLYIMTHINSDIHSGTARV